MKIYDFSDREESGMKKPNPYDPTLPAMTFDDNFVFLIFSTIMKIEASISDMKSHSDFRPFLQLKLLVSLVPDRAERSRLLNEVNNIYRQVLERTKISERDLGYPEKTNQVRNEFFWWQLTNALLPLVGDVISYIDLNLGISTRNAVMEA